MNYPIRDLPVSDWPRLAAEFTARGTRVPDPGLARIVVAEDGDRIIAFLVVQMVPHLEPLWIDPAYRGRVQWPRLVTAAEQQLGPGTAYAFAPDAHIARMTQLAGFTRRTWTVFDKEIR